MLKIIRALLGIYPKVTREQAMEIAKKHCEDQGWEWGQPVHVHVRLREYVVWTHADRRGANAVIAVSNDEGLVLRATRTPR
jgi:hypothetical protein